MSEPSFWEGAGGEPESGTGWVDDPDEIVVNDLSDFPSQEVLGLLNLGELQAKINVRDYEVVLRTLKMDEELEISLLIDEYKGTIDEGRALATALVAASVVTIDGRPLVTTLGPGEDKVRRKFDYVRTRMYWPVIRILYEEGYIPLVEQQVNALDEFRKK